MRTRGITIDLDRTYAPTHGAHHLTFFNRYYGSSCYPPLVAFVGFDREAEQYLCVTALRLGQASDGTLGVSCRPLGLRRSASPAARFLVRFYGGFATREIFDFLDAEPRLDYVVAMAKNAVLFAGRRARHGGGSYQEHAARERGPPQPLRHPS